MTSLTGETGKKQVQVEIKAAGLQGLFFPQGLPGLGSSRKYDLFAVEDNPFFYYLQSVEEQEIGLILTDPFTFFPDYSVELSDEDLKELEVEKREDILVLTTVTFSGEKNGEVRMTTNLAAPIVVNINKNLARQVIIADKMDQMRRPLVYSKK